MCQNPLTDGKARFLVAAACFGALFWMGAINLQLYNKLLMLTDVVKKWRFEQGLDTPLSHHFLSKISGNLKFTDDTSLSIGTAFILVVHQQKKAILEPEKAISSAR